VPQWLSLYPGCTMASESNKWQSMLLIVEQYSERQSSNTFLLSAKKFNQLQIKRLLIDNFFVFFAQYIGLKLNTFSLTPSPLWLATGSACAYLFLRGYGILPGMFLGNLLGFYFEKIGFSLALECATVLTLQGVLLLELSYRYVNPTILLYSQKQLLKFTLCTAILTAVASLMFVAICYPLLPISKAPWEYWIEWWLANFNAIVIFSSALITWDTYFLDIYSIEQGKKISLLFTLLLLLIFALINSHTFFSTSCLALSILLMTIIISAQFGWCGAVSAAFLSGILLCFAGFFDAKIFSTYSDSMSLLLVELFMCVNTITCLCVAIGFYDTPSIDNA